MTVKPVKETAPFELWAAIAPPGAPFGEPKQIDPTEFGAPFDLQVAADGRALIVYTSGDQLLAAERAPGASFGYPFTVADTIDAFGVVPVAVLRPDGGALVAWAGIGDATMTARSRTQPGIVGRTITVGRVTPLESSPFRVLLRGALGRIHLAREGSPDPAEPPAPDVRFSAPGSRALRGTAPLVLKFTCDAACDVLAQVAGREDLSASASLPAAGTRRLELEPIADPIPPRRGGKVRVLLRSGAPGSRLAARSTLALNLRRAPVVLPPRALDVTARRDTVATRSEDTDESRRTTAQVQG